MNFKFFLFFFAVIITHKLSAAQHSTSRVLEIKAEAIQPHNHNDTLYHEVDTFNEEIDLRELHQAMIDRKNEIYFETNFGIPRAELYISSEDLSSKKMVQPPCRKRHRNGSRPTSSYYNGPQSIREDCLKFQKKFASYTIKALLHELEENSCKRDDLKDHLQRNEQEVEHFSEDTFFQKGSVQSLLAKREHYKEFLELIKLQDKLKKKETLLQLLITFKTNPPAFLPIQKKKNKHSHLKPSDSAYIEYSPQEAVPL